MRWHKEPGNVGHNWRLHDDTLECVGYIWCSKGDWRWVDNTSIHSKSLNLPLTAGEHEGLEEAQALALMYYKMGWPDDYQLPLA